MKESGLMIKQKERVYTFILMELRIRESGITINNMGMDIKNGQMDHSMRGIMLKEQRKGMGFSIGQMEINTKESSNLTILKDLENILGLIKESMKDFGKIIKCMEKELLYGQMVENMRETM